MRECKHKTPVDECCPDCMVERLEMEASSGNSALLSAAKIGAKWMRWWLEHNECECEYGHSCGKTERERELMQMEAAIAAAEGTQP